MMIKQDSASPSSSTSTEAICFGSDIYNHGGDATKSICSSINDGNGTMK
jgi:hypothetical protein